MNSLMAAGFVSLLLSAPALGGTFRWAESRLVSDHPEESAGFGMSVCIDGDTALVGAWADESMRGAAYFFVREAGAWVLDARLSAADGDPGDGFGLSVFLDGDTALIGAPDDSDIQPLAGSAYVFVRQAGVWAQEAKLLPADPRQGAAFGYSVAVQGDTALLGARWDGEVHPESGSAYVFVREGSAWSQQAKMEAADPGSMKEFGTAVALDGDTALIGSPQDSPAGPESGSAYVFVREGETWSQQAKLVPSDPGPAEWFGMTVALQEDTALVGCWVDSDPVEGAGAAYVFIREAEAWSEQAKLVSTDIAPFDAFGTSVSLDGERALIGAQWDDDMGDVSGSAYVFERDAAAWTQIEKLVAGDGEMGDHLGMASSISGPCALVGAPMKTVGGVNGAGAAYAFCAPCSVDARLEAPDHVCKTGMASLDASASTAVSCPSGVLEYRFLDDQGVLRDWAADPLFQADLEQTTTYTVEARCMGDPACLGSDRATVAVIAVVAGLDAPADVCAGGSVPLDASGSWALECPGGALEYRFRIDQDVIRDWGDDPIHEDAPAQATTYTVDVRCGAAPDCLESAQALVLVVRVEAQVDGPRTLCQGDTAHLDASRSWALECPGGDLEFRFLADGALLCEWSADPACEDTPDATTTYTAEVRCAGRPDCVDTAQGTTMVLPDPVPAPLGASLRASRIAGSTDILFRWDDLPAGSVSEYELVRLAGPAAPTPAAMEDAPVVARALDGAAGALHVGGAADPARLAYYKVRGMSPCSHAPGPVTD